MKKIKFLRSAREDIRREKAYYRKIAPDLAEKFQAAVEAAVEAASEQPLAMQVIEHEVRRWPLKVFPHGVLYRDEDEFLLVLAVFHPKQSPDRWEKRVSG